MINDKWPPARMEIQIFVDEKQVIKFAWPKSEKFVSLKLCINNLKIA